MIGFTSPGSDANSVLFAVFGFPILHVHWIYINTHTHTHVHVYAHTLSIWLCHKLPEGPCVNLNLFGKLLERESREEQRSMLCFRRSCDSDPTSDYPAIEDSGACETNACCDGDGPVGIALGDRTART
uniref:Uncharacterized protein n=1 Tax=Chrysemys picta bellii TaxID=8478 RepID=A0A8C3IBY6_CHRPI